MPASPGSPPRARPRNLAVRIRAGLDLLQKRFGRPRPGRRRPPLDELILTILSQHTSDTNRDRAFRSLRGRFPTWEGVLRARPERVEEAIRVGGLARVKSRVIQDALRTVRRDHGCLDLGRLSRLGLGEAKAYLQGLRGVGEKTACCVLLFSCRRPAFPVDTHIHRVARRVGWVGGQATAARTHEVLGRLISEERFFEAHINLITLGRRVCGARRPDCAACPLRRVCRFAEAWRRRGTHPILRA